MWKATREQRDLRTKHRLDVFDDDDPPPGVSKPTPSSAMALVAHGYRRFAEDVDILLSPEGLRRFREKLEGLGYLPAFEGATKTFRDTRTRIKIKILTSGEYPGAGKPKAVVFPDPVEARVDRDNLWVIGLEKLIELKLASGLTAPHRLKDLA